MKLSHEPPSRRMRQLILSRIREVRDDINQDLVVIQWEKFNLNHWGDVGTVEIEYHTRGYRAVYGFDYAGRITIYMD